LRAAGAAVDHPVLPVAHGLSNADIVLASRWLQTAAAAAADTVVASATGS
jgi:hypothetical protein